MSDAKHLVSSLELLRPHLVLPPLVHVVSGDGEDDEAVESVDEEAGGEEGEGCVRVVSVEVASHGQAGHGHTDHPHLREQPGLDITKRVSLHVDEHCWTRHQSHPAPINQSQLSITMINQ